MSLTFHAFAYIALFLALTGIYIFACGFRLLERKRQLLSIPTSKIRDAAPGAVELHGIAQGRYTMPSPVSGKPCFYYDVSAWKRRGSAGEDWHKVAEESFALPFLLEDETGNVLVDLYGAQIDLLRNFHEEYGKALLQTNTEIPANVTAFLKRHNIAPDAAVRIEEHVIPPQFPLMITGTLTRNRTFRMNSEPKPLTANPDRILPPPTVTGPEPEGEPEPELIAPTVEIAPEPQVEVIHLSPEPDRTSAAEMSMQSRLAAALSRAGMHTPTTWRAPEAAQPAPAESVPRLSSEVRVKSIPAQEPAPATVLCRGTKDAAFIVSWRGRDALVPALDWQAIALVLTGPLVSLTGVYWLLVTLGWR